MLAKRILAGAAMLLALGGAVLLFINLYLQSAATTAKIQNRVSAAVRMPVRITSVTLTPWSGLKLNGITVPAGPEESRGYFLQAGEIAARVELIPFFRRELVIKTVTVKEPHLRWAQTEKGKWKLPEMADAPAAEPPGVEPPPVEPREEQPPPRAARTPPRAENRPAPFAVSVHHLRVQRGRFEFLDTNGMPLLTFADVEMNAPQAEASRVEGTAFSAMATLRSTLVFRQVNAPFTYLAGPPASLKINGLTAEIASGALRGDLTVQAEEPGSPYVLDARFERVDLNQLVAGLGGMPGHASGQLTGELRLSGKSGNPNEIAGKGRVALANGILKQHEFLQMLGQMLQIEELTQLNLLHAAADYHIAGGKVWIDELALHSPNLKLSARGKVKFNGKMDLDARLTINNRIARQLPKTIEANFIPGGASEERYIDFDITGTYAKPKTNLREKIIGKSYEGQALDLIKSLFGGGVSKKEKGKKKKIELAPEPSTPPIIPPVDLPPVPAPPAETPASSPAQEALSE